MVIYLAIPLVYLYLLYTKSHLLNPTVRNTQAALAKRREYEDGPELAPLKVRA